MSVLARWRLWGEVGRGVGRSSRLLALRRWGSALCCERCALSVRGGECVRLGVAIVAEREVALGLYGGDWCVGTAVAVGACWRAGLAERRL